MAQLSDSIERFIKELMSEDAHIELRRNELAQHFGCAPSQTRAFVEEAVRPVLEACGAGEEKVKSSLFRTRNHLKNTLEKEGITI